jgi:antitoxin component YwqK of YwqJK toxin-antitoxin module
MNKVLITFYTLIFCLSASFVWSLSLNDLFEMKGIYYNKLTELPFTGKIDGKTTGSFKNGKRDGSWLDYWENGQLQSKTNHKNGKLEGSWVSYHLNGQLRDKGQYKNGLKEGSWVSYFGNGQLRSKGNYKDGILIAD